MFSRGPTRVGRAPTISAACTVTPHPTDLPACHATAWWIPSKDLP